MTGNVSILTVITSDRKDPLIRARKVVVAHEGKSIPGINSDSVPDVVACKHIAAGPEYPVYRIVSRVDGVGQSNGVFVSGYLNVALLEGTHLSMVDLVIMDCAGGGVITGCAGWRTIMNCAGVIMDCSGVIMNCAGCYDVMCGSYNILCGAYIGEKDILFSVAEIW